MSHTPHRATADVAGSIVAAALLLAVAASIIAVLASRSARCPDGRPTLVLAGAIHLIGCAPR